MSRKLKKKINIRAKEPEVKKIKRYRKQRCAFVYVSSGNKCTNNAVGKSTLCKKHGGDPVIKENLIKRDDMSIMGFNTKYDPTSHPISFIDHSRSGLSEVEIAAKFGVSVDTIREWAEKYEIFNTAHEIGKALHESWWLEQGKGGLNNRGFNTGLYKYLTSNKLGYSDKMETKNMSMTIHGVLKVPDKMSIEEWESEVIDVNP